MDRLLCKAKEKKKPTTEEINQHYYKQMNERRKDVSSKKGTGKS